MKIYFAGSIRGGRDNKKIYLQIVNYLKEYGEVLTEHISNQELTEFGEDSEPDERLYKRGISWMRKSDVVVAEVSTPSLGIGYELAKAEELRKRILCLYRPQKGKRLSAMIAGNKNLTVKQLTGLTVDRGDPCQVTF